MISFLNFILIQKYIIFYMYLSLFIFVLNFHILDFNLSTFSSFKLSIYLPLYFLFSFYPSIYISIYICIFLCMHITIHLSLFLLNKLDFYLYIFLSIHLPELVQILDPVGLGCLIPLCSAPHRTHTPRAQSDTSALILPRI